MNPYAERTHEAMKDVLMTPNATGPAVHYHMIRGGKEKRNITVWEPGLVGTEYIKAYGHYHVDGIPETYWIVQGEGILLLQKRKNKDSKLLDDELESFTAISVKAGDKVNIQGDHGHAMVNTGSTWLVTIDDSPITGTTPEEISKPSHADYAPMKRMHGMGYYVVKGADEKPSFVANILYKNLPPVSIQKV